MDRPLNLHGTALWLNGTGILLRGPSGSGKSVLVLCLLDRWEGRGLPARLVADDRTDLTARAGRLIMTPPPALAGLIELRGRGILKRSCKSDVPLDLVVDLVPDLIRLPEPSVLRTEIAGVVIARAPVPSAGVVSIAHQMLLVVEAIAALGGP